MSQVSNRMHVLSASLRVGEFMMTDKPYDQENDIWWKILGITEERDPVDRRLLCRRFAVVNKGGYRKEIVDRTGAGRKFYRWTPRF